MPRREPLPLENPRLGRAYILRLDPVEPYTEDLDRPWEPDEALWLFYGALDGRSRRSYRRVWDYCEDYGTVPPLLSVLWALWHPLTPFGLAYRPDWVHPDYRARGLREYVAWRGHFYARDERGVLTDTGHIVPHPTPDDWWDVMRQVRSGR